MGSMAIFYEKKNEETLHHQKGTLTHLTNS